MIEPLVLQEYESREVALEFAALTALRVAAGRALTITPTDGSERWNIRATSLVGTVVTGDIKVLIRPKVSDANLFHMLEAAGDSLTVGSEVFDYDQTHDLIPAFATFFVRHLERALTRGLVRSYREEVERLVGVRGRVDIRSHVRLAGLPIPVECTFDEYTSNTQLNRIVAAGAARLARLPGVTTATRRALLRTLPLFEEVDFVTSADLAQPTTFSRLDGHFRGVERLARLALAGSSLLDATGAAGAATFLVDMNKIFETFVEDRLRRYLSGRADLNGQEPRTLDRDGYVHMRPDIVIRQNGVDTYVADSKYKLTADGFGRESDYYQLLAYCTALALPEGMLIYCQHDGLVPPREVVTRGVMGKRLVTAVVRLNGSPSDLEATMKDLADEIARSLHCVTDIAAAG